MGVNTLYTQAHSNRRHAASRQGGRAKGRGRGRPPFYLVCWKATMQPWRRQRAQLQQPQRLGSGCGWPSEHAQMPAASPLLLMAMRRLPPGAHKVAGSRARRHAASRQGGRVKGHARPPSASGCAGKNTSIGRHCYLCLSLAADCAGAVSECRRHCGRHSGDGKPRTCAAGSQPPLPRTSAPRTCHTAYTPCTDSSRPRPCSLGTRAFGALPRALSPLHPGPPCGPTLTQLALHTT
jgi:hypothetical protein